MQELVAVDLLRVVSCVTSSYLARGQTLSTEQSSEGLQNAAAAAVASGK